MDKKFLDKLNAYMAKPEQERDLMEGATILLQMNRNRILHQNITRNPLRHKERLFHELAKLQKIYNEGMTITGIIEMEKQVPEIESTTLKAITESTEEKTGAIHLGKREDHEDLPESIKALWVQNGEYARLMKSLHEKLKLMANMLPCDRYETLQQLIETDKKYRVNWEKYDTYTGQANTPEDEQGKAQAIDANRVSANRKYISQNKGKVAKYKEAQDLPKYHALLEKIQERYDELKSAGCNLDEKHMAELVAIGIKG